MADLSVQKLYTVGLNSYFPGIKVIGEENVEESKKMEIDESGIMKRVRDLVPLIHDKSVKEDQRTVWGSELELSRLGVWVDPLDGTKDYTVGKVQCVTSLVGITVDDCPEFGVVHKPFSDGDLEKQESYFGGKGLGVIRYSDSEATFASLPKIQDKEPQEMVLLTTCSHYSATTEKILKLINPSKLLRVGGAGNKMLGVIAGKGNCYVYPSKGLKLWDTCAGEALLRAVGGYISDCLGKPIVYGSELQVKGVIVARSKDLFDKLVKQLQDMPEIKKL